MNVLLWVIAVVLALAFLAAGLVKLTQPRQRLAELGMGWTASVHPRAIKVIGALEVLAAIGLTLPALLGIAPVLVPLAALGLALLMVGAAVVHSRRGEYPLVAVNLVLLVLAAIVAWGRFGAHHFTS